MSPDRHLNHSCDPNTCERHRHAGGIELVVRRPVTAGEEITVDHLVNNSVGDSWPCSCGAARCRGMTGHSFFTLPPALQAEYRPLLADWFLRGHDPTRHGGG